MTKITSLLLPLQNFDRDLGENLGEFLAGEIAEIPPRSQRDLGGQKLAEILAEISKSLRDSRQDLDEISKSRGQKLSENLDKISSKILGRSQSLGGQNLAENLGKTSSKISLRYQNLGGQKDLAEKTEVFSAMFPRYFKMSILRFRKAFHKFVD